MEGNANVKSTDAKEEHKQEGRIVKELGDPLYTIICISLASELVI